MMCDDHSGVLIEIPTASFRGEGGHRRAIDACLAPLVQALNQAGFGTVASCCGHGKHRGTIALADGRELFILPDFDSARALDDLLADRVDA
jgi:hypothetical protein